MGLYDDQCELKQIDSSGTLVLWIIPSWVNGCLGSVQVLALMVPMLSCSSGPKCCYRQCARGPAFDDLGLTGWALALWVAPAVAPEAGKWSYPAAEQPWRHRELIFFIMNVYSPATFPDSVLCWPIWEPSFPSNGATQSTTGFRAEETAPLMIELSRWPMQRCCFGPTTGWDVGIPTTWDLSRHTWPHDNWGSGTGRTPLLGGRLLEAGGLLPAFHGLAAAAILEARNWGLSRTTLVLEGLWVLRGALGGRLYIVPNRTVHGACGGGFDWSWIEGWLKIHGARLALVHSEAVPRAVSGGLVRCRIMAWLQIDRAAGQRLVLVSNRAVLSGCERGLVWHRLGPRLGIHGALGWHLAIVRNGTVLAVEGLSEVGSCLDWISIGLWGSGWLLLLTELFSGVVMEDLSDTGWGLDWGSVELWVGTLPLFVMEQSPGLAAEGLPNAGSGLDWEQ